MIERDMKEDHGQDMDNLEREIQYGSRTAIRWVVLFAVLFAAVFYIIFRYGEIMLGSTGGAPSRKQAGGAERGAILDRNGRILAIEAEFADIGITPSKIRDAGAIAALLAPLLDLDEQDIRDRVIKTNDFIYLKKRVDKTTARGIEALIAEKRLTGVTVDMVRGRVYPEEMLAAQIIGFTGNENSGLEGIEFAFDHDLSPKIAPGGESVAGSRVILSIDANIQYILEEIAARVLEEHGAESVMLTAMNPRTGDILGSASLPGFNPNNFRAYPQQYWAFRPAVWAYEPGSVFKIFSIAGILDSGLINAGTTFYCDGEYEHTTNRGERVSIKCLGVHGTVNARDIIMVSCNAGAGYAADRISADSFNERIRRLGFGVKTASGAPGESAGFLRPPVRWSARSKPTISMGQEIAVSTLQMLKAATAIAGDGVVRTPRLVSRIEQADGTLIREYQPAAPVKAISSQTARMMRSYMRDGASVAGTGWRAFIDDIPLAVKTGTAEIIDPVSGAYSRTDFIASCMAMLPEADPSLILYITIFKPRGESYYGGRIAAPYIREAAEALVNYLGIPRGRSQQVSHAGTVTLPSGALPPVGNTVPNFTGFSKRQLLPLLLRDDIIFEISGDGWVRRQSPPPGAPFKEGTVIRLELE